MRLSKTALRLGAFVSILIALHFAGIAYLNWASVDYDQGDLEALLVYIVGFQILPIAALVVIAVAALARLSGRLRISGD